MPTRATQCDANTGSKPPCFERQRKNRFQDCNNSPLSLYPDNDLYSDYRPSIAPGVEAGEDGEVEILAPMVLFEKLQDGFGSGGFVAVDAGGDQDVLGSVCADSDLIQGIAVNLADGMEGEAGLFDGLPPGFQKGIITICSCAHRIHSERGGFLHCI